MCGEAPRGHMLSQTAERVHLSGRRGRWAVWSLLMIKSSNILTVSSWRAFSEQQIRTGSCDRSWSASGSVLTRTALRANRAGADPAGVEPWRRPVESPCRQRSASRFNEGRGELWPEVFVCYHVTFPERHGQRRRQIASDFSSRCLEMVLMLWIMSAGE